MSSGTTSRMAGSARNGVAALLLAAGLTGPAWPQETGEVADPATGDDARAAEPPEQAPGTATGAEPDGAAAPPVDAPAEEGQAADGEAADAGDGAAAADTGDAAEGAKGEDGPLVVEAEEGSVLDDQTFEGEDDDFIPSEEVPVDEPIPFPSDI